MSKHSLLEMINAILQVHQITNGLITIAMAYMSIKLHKQISHNESYPSLGSSMFFKLMYSSYSNVPLNSGCSLW